MPQRRAVGSAGARPTKRRTTRTRKSAHTAAYRWCLARTNTTTHTPPTRNHRSVRMCAEQRSMLWFLEITRSNVCHIRLSRYQMARHTANSRKKCKQQQKTRLGPRVCACRWRTFVYIFLSRSFARTHTQRVAAHGFV